MPQTKYRAPLVPVLTRGQAVNIEDCKDLKKDEKLPYSKFTTPHFMEDDDEDKYIINGKFFKVQFPVNGWTLKLLTPQICMTIW